MRRIPANMFIATAQGAVAAGLVARFIDVDPRSGLIELARTAAFPESGDDCAAVEHRERLLVSLRSHPHLTQLDVKEIRSAVTATVSILAL